MPTRATWTRISHIGAVAGGGGAAGVQRQPGARGGLAVQPLGRPGRGRCRRRPAARRQRPWRWRRRSGRATCSSRRAWRRRYRFVLSSSVCVGGRSPMGTSLHAPAQGRGLLHMTACLVASVQQPCLERVMANGRYQPLRACVHMAASAAEACCLA